MEYHYLSDVLPNGNLTVTVMHGKTKIIKENRTDYAHIHDYCELYLNISGDVSFAVEGNIYNLISGDIIITKPNEIHYCIYNSDSTHEYYCLWINATEEYNYLLSKFYDRNKGENAKITLDNADRLQIIEELDKIITEEKNKNLQSANGISAVTTVLETISKYGNTKSDHVPLSDQLDDILKFIDKNYKEQCSVDSICNQFYLSRSTVTRMFKNELNTTPARYIENRRLAHSKEMLKRGFSVIEASEKSGFPDYSHFIALFKKRFGITPLKFKNK